MLPDRVTYIIYIYMSGENNIVSLWDRPIIDIALGDPRIYPTSPDYSPPDPGWGIVWAIGVYPGRYHI